MYLLTDNKENIWNILIADSKDGLVCMYVCLYASLSERFNKFYNFRSNA